MRTALGRYNRKGSTLTSPPRWASWWSRLCKRKGTHISVFISICARIWSLSNLHRRSFWLCVEPLVVITVWSAWFIFDPSEGCQGWWWRPRRWCEPPPTTSTSGPNILGTLWWQKLEDFARSGFSPQRKRIKWRLGWWLEGSATALRDSTRSPCFNTFKWSNNKLWRKWGQFKIRTWSLDWLAKAE